VYCVSENQNEDEEVTEGINENERESVTRIFLSWIGMQIDKDRTVYNNGAVFVCV
jgi:hypothetical protein